MSASAKPAAKKYTTFGEFYPFYLTEHSNRTCRRLHFLGSTLALVCVVLLAVTGNAWWIAGALLAGYGFAWIGHFAFEKNHLPLASEMPHGGVKRSGFGSDLSRYSFEEYTNVKHVMADLTGEARKPWHFTVYGDQA